MYQGTTDAQGRTAVFAFNQAIPKVGWNLRPRTGSGLFGEQMVKSGKISAIRLRYASRMTHIFIQV